jgi:mono/diheme cytochrome c family protein
MTRTEIRVGLAKFGAPLFAGLSLTIALMPSPQLAAQTGSKVTFAKDIAPILQRSCQNCHRPGSVAPMSLIGYEEVRPWARSIKLRTGLGTTKMGVMPPWFIDKTVGIQAYEDDPSLSEKEIATIAEWVDGGAARGNPADMPSPVVYTAADKWDIGEPDLIVDSPPVTMKANAPDWWGALPPVPTGLKEDRYVSAVQFKEVSSLKGATGGRFIFHHAIHALIDPDATSSLAAAGGGGIGSPHEVGRNAEFFDPQAGRLMKAGSQLVFPSIHMHANNEDTTAHLRVAYKLHPKDYKPTRRLGTVTFGNGEIDLRPMQAGQVIHLYTTLQQHAKLTTFEPHMHASGVKMCIEAIYGGRTETLTCSGYDHNWVRVYKYKDDAAPLLPKGTLLHVTAIFDTTPANRNVIDPRNWQGLGHRSIDNMALVFVPTINLTDDEFKQEMATRRKHLNLAKGQAVLGCPLCGFEELPKTLGVSLTSQGQ